MPFFDANMTSKVYARNLTRSVNVAQSAMRTAAPIIVISDQPSYRHATARALETVRHSFRAIRALPPCFGAARSRGSRSVWRAQGKAGRHD